MARPITKITLEKATIKQLKSLGTYRKEFDPLIKIYAGLLFQYTKYEKEHAERDYEVAEIYVNKAGAENYRKIPLVNVMETLRRDILTYSDRLMLNPKSLGEIIAQDSDSSIIDIMNKLGGKG
nr:MAG TPA: terminase small subunit [Caudoviricetes sp.]